jgi:hypothetical protein
MSNIEERARELDEIRRSKAIRRSDIDEDLYAEPEDLSKSVINSNAVIDQMWQDILHPVKGRLRGNAVVKDPLDL